MTSRRRGRQRGYLFEDRVDAGQQLGARLAAWRDAGTFVLALPRGGVPVASEVAHYLGAPLDVVIARKIGAPGQPELAIGAVTADGGLYLDTAIVRQFGVTDDQLDRLIVAEQEIARGREVRFRRGRPPPSLTGRSAIVVDDGLATGATMLAAIRSVRRMHPRRIIVAVPVGSQQAVVVLAAVVERMVCLYTPEPFRAVGAFYRDFEQVSDAEVDAILADFHLGDTG